MTHRTVLRSDRSGIVVHVPEEVAVGAPAAGAVAAADAGTMDEAVGTEAMVVMAAGMADAGKSGGPERESR